MIVLRKAVFRTFRLEGDRLLHGIRKCDAHDFPVFLVSLSHNMPIHAFRIYCCGCLVRKMFVLYFWMGLEMINKKIVSYMSNLG